MVFSDDEWPKFGGDNSLDSSSKSFKDRASSMSDKFDKKMAENRARSMREMDEFIARSHKNFEETKREHEEQSTTLMWIFCAIFFAVLMLALVGAFLKYKKDQRRQQEIYVDLGEVIEVRRPKTRAPTVMASATMITQTQNIPDEAPPPYEAHSYGRFTPINDYGKPQEKIR